MNAAYSCIAQSRASNLSMKNVVISLGNKLNFLFLELGRFDLFIILSQKYKGTNWLTGAKAAFFI